MQNSIGVVKHGFSIPSEDYEWIKTYIDKAGFHSNMADFVSAAILKTMDLVHSTGLVEGYDRVGLLSFLEKNFFDTIPPNSKNVKIQVRFPIGQDKALYALCMDCSQYSKDIKMVRGDESDVCRNLVLCAIRFYISYRSILDHGPLPPEGYKHACTRAMQVRSHVDVQIMCKGLYMEELM